DGYDGVDVVDRVDRSGVGRIGLVVGSPEFGWKRWSEVDRIWQGGAGKYREKYAPPSPVPAPAYPEYMESSDDEEMEPFKTDESTTTPPPPTSPYHIIPFSKTRLRRTWISVRPHTPPSPSIEALIIEYTFAPTPPLPPLSSLLPLIAFLPLPLPSPDSKAASRQTRLALARGVDYGFIYTLDASIRATAERVMIALDEVDERMTDLAATHRYDSEEFYTRHQDAQDDQAFLLACISTLEREMRYFALSPFLISERPIMLVRHGLILRIGARLWRLRSENWKEIKMAPKKTTTPMTDAAIKGLIAQGVTDVLAEYEGTKNSRNGDDSHESGCGRRRTVPTAHECMYNDFLKCQPLNFKGTEGVVGLTQWFKKMESVFHISNCTVACQIKFSTCTLLGSALTWWNSYVKTVRHDSAYGMPWKTLMKMLTNKYCPRSEIKKLEIEIWNLKVKGTDVVSYSQRFQKLGLMYGRMFLEESNQVEKYICTFTERQAENKRKLDENTRNNETQQQPFKRQNVARAYTTGPGEKKEYGGSLLLCTKCNYHHTGSCVTKCTNCKRVGHLARDYRSPAAANNQRSPREIQKVVTCYECGIQGHYKKDCRKLKNKNRGNQAGNGEAHAKAYALGGNKENPDSNVMTVCEEANKVESCPSEIILDDILAIDSIVRFDFE
nr:hypothetical protein [Tanacetum cinerariifolium]